MTISRPASLAILSVAAALLSLAPVCVTGGGTVKVRTDTVAVAPGALINVSGDNLDLVVRVGEPGLLSVTSTLRNFDRIDYSVLPATVGESPEVNVRARIRPRVAALANASMVMAVPEDARLNVETSSGDITVEGPLTGAGRLKSGGGDVSMRDISADFDIETANGDVTLRRAEGAFEVRTTNGHVTFDGVLRSERPSRFQTTFANIDIILRGAPDLTITAATEGGRIEAGGLDNVVRAPGRLSATVGDGSGRLEVSATNGVISIRR